MQRKKVSATIITFWMLMIALFSAISTTIFSESFLNDSFGFSLMGIAIIGLCLNIIYMFINAIFEICNPSN